MILIRYPEIFQTESTAILQGRLASIGTMLSDGMNTATSSLLTFSVTVDWKRIGSELASSANTFLANTDFSQAGKALGQALKVHYPQLTSLQQPLIGDPLELISIIHQRDKLDGHFKDLSKCSCKYILWVV